MCDIDKNGGDTMFPNLLGQKAFHKMSNNDMAKVIGVSRPSFENKMKTGKFTVSEVNAYIRFFRKPYEYLFATDEENQSA